MGNKVIKKNKAKFKETFVKRLNKVNSMLNTISTMSNPTLWDRDFETIKLYKSKLNKKINEVFKELLSKDSF